jgi:hypothetical protein
MLRVDYLNFLFFLAVLLALLSEGVREVQSSEFSFNTLYYGKLPPHISSDYTHYAAINVFFVQSSEVDLIEVKRVLAYAQQYFDRCNIYLHLGKAVALKAPAWFGEWENFWFDNDTITDWERNFFSLDLPDGNNLLLVDSLNWTLEGAGTVGSAYPSFLLDYYFQDDPQSRRFFVERMEGDLVVGRYRARWTIAHELGHAVMNLQHVDDDQGDIMWNGVVAGTPQYQNYFLLSAREPEFTEESCRRGRSNRPFVRELSLTSD